jgi:hypothetical protein
MERETMKNTKLLLMLLALLLPLLVTGCASKNTGQDSMAGDDMNMKMHHQHMLMNHGLSMVTEGSNEIMLAYMDMAPKVDAIAHEHGHNMLNNGKKVINYALSGPEMMKMMKGEHAQTAHMKYTHEIGESMLVVVDLLEKMAKSGSMPADMMAMHHQHMLINHAMDMAAQGANMVMLGKMGMVGGDIDTYSVDHGNMMLNNAQSQLTEVMSGAAMMDMHAKGKTPGGHADMMSTHKLGEAAMKVVHLLNNMPAM